MKSIVKLKEDVSFEALREFGFEEDPSNCDKGDVYFHMNNYYIQVGEDFRVTVNLHSRCVDVLCLAKEPGLHNMFNIKPLFDLLASNLVEVVEKEEEK